MLRKLNLSRRTFLAAAVASTAGLASCATSAPTGQGVPIPRKTSRPSTAASDDELETLYAAIVDGGYLIPPVPYRELDPSFYRQRVSDPTGERPGTVVVDTPGRFLYLVEPGGTAMRYGVGIGREGFAWEGEGTIHWRQAWPRWKPPNEMIARKPSSKNIL